ncbi:hypothetical protein SBRCBS47491_005555 [Sporothrix bragantina]|uniref:DUF7728 domain-containing protein n=1 Tax=Sporothrix bragantina TaxID=671064 RepID=A0ABP0BZR4_9PEZI
MLPKALLAAALASSTASAFLLPPTTDVEAQRKGHRHHKGVGAAVEHSDDVSMISPFYHEFTKVKVPCPGCSMQVRKHGKHDKHHKGDDEEDDSERTEDNKDGKVITLTDVPNHINLFFKIDHADDGDRLLANGFEIYPNVDLYNGALMAAQAPDHFHHKGKKHHHHDDEEEEKAEHEKHGKHHHHEENEEEKQDGDEELKKRHRGHRKHDDDDDVEEKAKDGEVMKHRKHHDKEHHEYEMAEIKEGKGKFHGKHHGKHGKHLVKVPLGYSMQTQVVGQDESNGMEVVALALQIIEVNNVFVQSIPAVNIRLIRTPEPNGGLMIARIDVVDEANGEQTKKPHHGHHKTDEERMAALKEELDACSNILCRWKAIISSSIKAHHSGCAGKAMAKAMGGDDGEKDGKHRHHHSHHHHEEDEGDDSEDGSVAPAPGRHMRHHSFGGLVKKFAAHVLLPIFIGAAVGAASFFIGFAIGTLIVGLFRLIFRRNTAKVGAQSQKVAVSTVETRHADEEAVDEEKAGLMATASEELPPYEDNDTKGSR